MRAQVFINVHFASHSTFVRIHNEKCTIFLPSIRAVRPQSHQESGKWKEVFALAPPKAIPPRGKQLTFGRRRNIGPLDCSTPFANGCDMAAICTISPFLRAPCPLSLCPSHWNSPCSQTALPAPSPGRALGWVQPCKTPLYRHPGPCHAALRSRCPRYPHASRTRSYSESHRTSPRAAGGKRTGNL